MGRKVIPFICPPEMEEIELTKVEQNALTKILPMVKKLYDEGSRLEQCRNAAILSACFLMQDTTKESRERVVHMILHNLLISP